MVKTFTAVGTNIDEIPPGCARAEPPWTEAKAITPPPPAPHARLAVTAPLPAAKAAPESKPAAPLWRHGWPVPSTITPQPDEARACIHLPEFDALLLEKARVIS